MTARKRRRGFNLIEAAIVLGVVGLVIGGIWVAAAAVSSTLKINETIKGNLSTVRCIQRLISSADSSSIGAVAIEQTVRDAGCFPANWKASGTGVESPLGGPITVFNFAPDGYFYLQYDGLTKSDCTNLVFKMTALADKDASAFWIDSNSGDFYVGTYHGTAFSVTLNQARQVACRRNPNTVAFAFKYTRTN